MHRLIRCFNSKTFRCYGLKVLLCFCVFLCGLNAYAQKVQVLPQNLLYPKVMELVGTDSIFLFSEPQSSTPNFLFSNICIASIDGNQISQIKCAQPYGGDGYPLRLSHNRYLQGFEEFVNPNGLLEHGVYLIDGNSELTIKMMFNNDSVVFGFDVLPRIDLSMNRHTCIGFRTPVINGFAQTDQSKLCYLVLDDELEVLCNYYWDIPGMTKWIDLVQNESDKYLIFEVFDWPPSTIGIGNGGRDIAIMKITNDTNVQWIKSYGTSAPEFNNYFLNRRFAVWHNGHLYFQFRCGTGTCLMKLDEDGNLIESKEYSIAGYDGFFQQTLNVRSGHNELVHTGLVQQFATGNLTQNGGLIVFDEDLNVKQARKIGTPSGEDHILEFVQFFDDGSFVSTAGASTYYGGPLLFYSDENLNTGCLDMGPLEVIVQDYPMNVLDYHFPTLHHVGWYYDTLYTTTDTYTMTDACYCEGNIEDATAGANQSICNGTFTWLGSAVNPSELIYQWSPGTGLEDPNSPFTRAAPQQTTTYTLTVIDTTGLNCYRTREIQVTVAVNNCETGDFIVMPSPNNGTFTVHHGAFFGHLNIELSVYDVRGRLVWEQPLSGQQPETEVVLPPHVATGMYVVRAKSEQLEREAKMVVMR
jgi:hypothetical protein